MAKEHADDLKAGWQRAMRAALSWARDPGEVSQVKKAKPPKGRNAITTGRKKSPARAGSKSKPDLKRQGNGNISGKAKGPRPRSK
jgi:hypothetical protein